MTVSATSPIRQMRHRSWVDWGTDLFLQTSASLSDAELSRPSLLTGWSRRHLLAHVAANAEALGRLVDWARTGVPNPMYSSPQQRAQDIEEGSQLDPAILRTWVVTSAQGLGRAMDELPESAWSQEVVTGQGRRVPASIVPWLRSREVLIHAVDLGSSVTFADLPRDFLAELVTEIAAKRSGEGRAISLRAIDHESSWTISGREPAVSVSGPLSAIAGWLAGRDSRRLRTTNGSALPTLKPWL